MANAAKTGDPKAYRQLTGRTLGIIGCGNIGRHVAQIASQGFGMRVLGYDAYAGVLPGYIERVADLPSQTQPARYPPP